MTDEPKSGVRRQSRFQTSQRMDATLFLSSVPARMGNDVSVTAFQERLESRSYEGLTIIRRLYRVRREEVAQPSFEEALDLLY